MPSTYSNLKIQLMATGENTTTWGNVTNTNLGVALEEAIANSANITFASNNITLSLTDTNTTQAARHMRLRCTGATGGATRNLNVPNIQKPYLVQNDCADSIVVKTSAGTGVTVPAGRSMWVYADGVNVVDAVTHLTQLTLGSSLPLASGGTGANTAGNARANLGLGTLATQNANAVAITGGAITGITDLAVADGGTGASTAADARTNLGLGTLSTQNASTVAVTGGSITGITDLAIADGGTGASTAVNARANLGATTVGDSFFTIANPSAIRFPRVNANNTVSLLTDADFRTAIGVGTGTGTVTSVALSGGTTGLTVTGSPVTTNGTFTLEGTLAVANGGTGANTAANARTNLGLGTLSTQNASTVAITGGSITGITDLAIADGGTGASTAVNARTNLGATTVGDSFFTLANPGAIRFPRVNANNTVSLLTDADFRTAIGAGTGTGTVTSVALSGGTTGLTVTGSPITTGGTFTLEGTLAVANGGTGANTAANARTNLAAAGSGANTDITSLRQLVDIVATGTPSATTLGFRGIPQVSQSSAYTLTSGDEGRHISISAGGITIPANASVSFPVGTTIVIYNNSASAQNIAITSDTLRLAGTATTGTRSLQQRGVATLMKVASTEWVASGSIT